MKNMYKFNFGASTQTSMWLLLLSVFCLGSSGAFAQFPDPYCAVYYSNTIEPITLVQFAGINQTSSAATGGTAHEDYTEVFGSVNAGLSYPIVMNGNSDGNYTNHFWVYADWNQDGDFDDPDETYFAGSIVNNNGVTDDPADYAQATIQVPASALVGQTRLRILKRFNSVSDPGPCNTNGGYGQAEDYTLNVAEANCTPPAATFSTVADCANNEYSVSVDVTSLGSASSLTLTDGTITYGTPITTTGTYIAGPFIVGVSTQLYLEHNEESLCDFSSGLLIVNNCPPLNDDANGAVMLTVGGGCPTVLFTNTLASRSPGEPVNSCYQASAENYSSVWFSFVAPASGAVRVATDYAEGSLNDTHLGVFSAIDVNNYNTFTIVACDDDNGIFGSKSIAYATGLIPSLTYYIMVNGYNNANGTFCVTVDELSDAMISDGAVDCSGGQTLYRRPSFNGMSSLVDNSGLLRAIVRNNTVMPEASLVSLNGSLSIHDGAVRTDDHGVAYLNRNILINTSEAGDFDVQLFFLDSELAALAAVDPSASLANLNLSKVSGSTCSSDFSGVATLLPQTGSGSVNGVSWVTVNTDGFSNFFVASGTIPLPVDVLNFRGKQEGVSNRLLWETQNEVNLSHFDLQRSEDGVVFRSIAIIAAAQNNGAYSFVDAQPVKGANHYRLNMVDVDGKQKLSSVVTLVDNVVRDFVVEVYPNPTTDKISVAIKGQTAANGQVMITDAVGKVVRSLAVESSEMSIDMSGLPSGIYLIKYSDDAHHQVIKMSKQ